MQNERLEICVIGWCENGQPCILGHRILIGSTLEDATWNDLDQLLKMKFQHPSGNELPLEAVAIDFGGTGGRTQRVYQFCANKAHRRIYLVKGVPGRAAPAVTVPAPFDRVALLQRKGQLEAAAAQLALRVAV